MWGVTIGVGIAALIGAIAIATVGRMKWPRVAAALVLTGAAGLIGGSFGPKLHDAVTLADTKVANAIGEWTGTWFFGAIGIICTVVWCLWVYHNQIDLRTLGLSAALPLVINLIPGMAGTIAIFVIGVIPQVTAGILGLLLFGSWGG